MGLSIIVIGGSIVMKPPPLPINKGSPTGHAEAGPAVAKSFRKRLAERYDGNPSC